jgi:hypothetical protein
MINDIKKNWQLLWELIKKSYFTKPPILVGDKGYSVISGYMVFMERVK